MRGSGTPRAVRKNALQWRLSTGSAPSPSNQCVALTIMAPSLRFAQIASMVGLMEGITDRVLSLIEASGQSRRAFAQDIGLDDSKLSKSLSGARRFSSLDLARIAEKCGVTVDWLVTGEEPRWPSRPGRPAGRRARRWRPRSGTAPCARTWPPSAGSSRGGRWRLQIPERHVCRAGPALAAAALARVAAAGLSVADADLPALVENGVRRRRGGRGTGRRLRRARGVVGRGEADRPGHVPGPGAAAVHARARAGPSTCRRRPGRASRQRRLRPGAGEGPQRDAGQQLRVRVPDARDSLARGGRDSRPDRGHVRGAGLRPPGFPVSARHPAAATPADRRRNV